MIKIREEWSLVGSRKQETRNNKLVSIRKPQIPPHPPLLKGGNYWSLTLKKGDTGGFQDGNKLEANSKRKPCLLFLFFCLLFTVYCSLSYAAQEMLKTQKVKVGEKAPFTDILKKANDEGKIIVLVLLSNPIQCNKCDELMSLLEKEAEPYKKDAAFITAGGQDIIGAASEETISLKKLYGFVTMGEPWTFIIDRQGVLRKIFIGLFNRQELKDILDEIMGRKE